MVTTPKQFQQALLHWYDEHGRKNLPWQKNKTPYRVWLSEVMLQQTQVTTVIPYFERFLAAFPDITSLANANLDHVLHLWSGLGYYSRARNLHRAAQLVVEKYQSRLPNTLDALTALPGIGLSTAGAILSLAFNHPAPILDGNVKRVLSRFHGITEPINDKGIEKKLWQIASQFTSNQHPAHYTQAMMDLGAMVCLRNQPKCNLCPVRPSCIAHKKELTTLLPIKKPARPLAIRATTFILLQKDNKILLCKKPSSGIWGGLWCPPEIEGEPNVKVLRHFCRQHLQLTFKKYAKFESFRHTFTHYHLDIFPVHIISQHLSTLEIIEKSQQIWYNLKKPQTIGLPKPIQSMIRVLL